MWIKKAAKQREMETQKRERGRERERGIDSDEEEKNVIKQLCVCVCEREKWFQNNCRPTIRPVDRSHMKRDVFIYTRHQKLL